MQCHVCKTDNEPTSRFCGGCGAQLEATIPPPRGKTASLAPPPVEVATSTTQTGSLADSLFVAPPVNRRATFGLLGMSILMAGAGAYLLLTAPPGNLEDPAEARQAPMPGPKQLIAPAQLDAAIEPSQSPSSQAKPSQGLPASAPASPTRSDSPANRPPSGVPRKPKERVTQPGGRANGPGTVPAPTPNHDDTGGGEPEEPSPAIPPAKPADLADQVRRAMEESQGAVRRCHDQASAGGLVVQGEIDVAFQVLPEGTVVNASPVRDTTGSATLGHCLSAVVSSWAFTAGQPSAIAFVRSFSF